MARRKNTYKLFESVLDQMDATDARSSERVRREMTDRFQYETNNPAVEPEKYRHLFVISYVVDFIRMEREAGYMEKVRDGFHNGLEDLRETMAALFAPNDFKTSMVVIGPGRGYTEHTLDVYRQLNFPVVSNDEPFLSYGTDSARLEVGGFTVNLRVQFNLRDKSVRFYTKFMRRFIPIAARMMQRTDKDLRHSEVLCYTFLKPEWANDPKFEYFCDLDELADELTIDYRNKITFCSYIAKTYCAFNKIGQTEDVSRYINAFHEQSDRLTRILNSK